MGIKSAYLNNEDILKKQTNNNTPVILKSNENLAHKIILLTVGIFQFTYLVLPQLSNPNAWR